MARRIQFPTFIYNGEIAYQLEPQQGYTFFRDVDFDYHISQYGFLIPRDMTDYIEFGKFTLGLECIEDTILTFLHPHGFIYEIVPAVDHSKIKPVPIIIPKIGLISISGKYGYSNFIKGSLAYTNDVTKTAKVFRDNFNIPKNPIYIEKIEELLLSMERTHLIFKQQKIGIM